eukprot:scaffold7.g3595.t1
MARTEAAEHGNNEHREDLPALQKQKVQLDATGHEEAWTRNLRGDDALVSGPAGERPDWWWTGPTPVPGGCAGVLPDGSITSLPAPNLATCTRQQLADYFDNTWALTEVLFSALQGEEAYYRPPYHNLRHPFIFYYGHVAVFYTNKLRVAGLVERPIDARLEDVCEVGVDEMGWDDLSKNDMLWPSVREVLEYRRTVYAMVREIILSHPCLDARPIAWDSQAWALFMAIEHERIHIETSSVLMRELPLHLLRPPPQWPAYHPSVLQADRPPAPNDLIAVPEQEVTLGKPADWPSYGWDNEYGERKFALRAFKASRQLVSNAEFLEFVRDGGYRTQRWWSEAGWRWRTFRNTKWPAFWVADGPQGLHRYKLRLLFEVVPLAPALPAVVNHHEAKAYCAWLSARHGLGGEAAYRLTTEPEQAALRAGARDASGRVAQDPVMARSGADFRGVANLNLAYGAESGVDALPPVPTGFRDVAGSLWQWQEDRLAGLPGGRGVQPYYDDFSTPCYDGEHQVILGGSFISTGDEASVFARYQFRPHFFQHAGFRLVSGTGPPQTSCQDSPPPHVGSWDPSTKRSSVAADAAAAEALQRALLAAYGAPADLLAGPAAAAGGLLAAAAGEVPYPAHLAALLFRAAAAEGVGLESVVEVGCGVGGLALRLAAGTPATPSAGASASASAAAASASSPGPVVLGLDHDARAVAVAAAAARNGAVEAARAGEGALAERVRLAVPGDAAARARASFRQMDPCSLAPDLGQHDAVVLNRVLERIPSPKAPLGRMAGPRGLVRPGGLLLVIADWAWHESVCPPQLWLGGREEGGAPLRSADGLAAALRPAFRLVAEEQVPCLTRQGDRAFQLTLVHASVWRQVE